jgi:hypothetical protein
MLGTNFRLSTALRELFAFVIKASTMIAERASTRSRLAIVAFDVVSFSALCVVVVNGFTRTG